MKRFAALLASQEQLLIDRARFLAQERGIMQFAAQPEDSQRSLFAGLAKIVISALDEPAKFEALEAGAEYRAEDPLVALAALEAGARLEQGIDPGLLVSLLKCFQQACLDLVRKGGFERLFEERCRLYLERLMARLEVGFCLEWTKAAENRYAEELDLIQRVLNRRQNGYRPLPEPALNPQASPVAPAKGSDPPEQTVPAVEGPAPASQRPVYHLAPRPAAAAGVAGDTPDQDLLRRLENLCAGLFGQVTVLNDLSGQPGRERVSLAAADANAVLANLAAQLIAPITQAEITSLVLDSAKAITGSPYAWSELREPGQMPVQAAEAAAGPGAVAHSSADLIFLREGEGRGWRRRGAGQAKATGLPAAALTIPILRLATVPVHYRGIQMGQLCVANAAGDYLAADLDLLERLAAIYAAATMRQRFERAWRQWGERYRLLLDAAEDAVFAISLDERGLPAAIFVANAAACQWLGYTEAELHSLPPQALFDPEWVEKLPAVMEKLRAAGRIEFEAMQVDKAGQYIPVEVRARLLELEGQVLMLAVAREMTARKLMEEELRSLSLTDELTGLYNRRGFMTLAGQQLKIANRTSRGMLLIFADLDDLKGINDSLGHPEGDLALIKTANILRKTFRDSDIIARLGGDEFAVLAIETHADDINTLSTRLRKGIAAANNQANRRFELSLSVGIARYDPDHPCALEELLQQADTLMYDQKMQAKGHPKAKPE